MDPVTVSVTIDRPREEIFSYLADIANHAEFTDHYLVDWHLTREQSVGSGAGARFRIKAPLNRFAWGDATFIEVEPPWRIVEAGRGGKGNRTRMRGIFTLDPGPSGTTRVTWSVETRPALLSDRLMESLGQRGWLKRRNGGALKRLRRILEEDRDRGRRVTLAGR